MRDEVYRLRKLLWSLHGHNGLYGDDGEMQCAECILDFKRGSIDELEYRLNLLICMRQQYYEELNNSW